MAPPSRPQVTVSNHERLELGLAPASPDLVDQAATSTSTQLARGQTGASLRRLQALEVTLQMCRY